MANKNPLFIMALKIKTPYNYKPRKGKVFTKPSLTSPDKAIPLRKLMKNVANGIPVPQTKNPVYEDPNFPSEGIDFRKLDMIDIQNIARKAAKTKQEAEAVIKEKKEALAAEKEAKKQQKIEEELRRKIKAEQGGSNEH